MDRVPDNIAYIKKEDDPDVDDTDLFIVFYKPSDQNFEGSDFLIH
jgi:hypothetical protein